MSDIKNLKGCVFEHNGKVAGAVPPIDNPDAIPFHVLSVHPATWDFPDWANIMSGNIPIRINPAICQPPYLRLFDIIALVNQTYNQLIDLQPKTTTATLGGQEFVLFATDIQEMKVIMVDTLERFRLFQ